MKVKVMMIEKSFLGENESESDDDRTSRLVKMKVKVMMIKYPFW